MNSASRQCPCSPSSSKAPTLGTCFAAPRSVNAGGRSLRRRVWGVQQRPYSQPVKARRDSRFSADDEDDEGPFAWERRPDSVRFRYGEKQVQVPNQTLWMTGLALLGAGVLIGPVVAGLAVMAVSLGVAASFGAFALSIMFIPMTIFMLMFGGFFGGFALLGVGLIVPKILSLVVTGGALALGWSLVNGQRTKTPQVTASSSKSGRPLQPAPKAIDPAEEEARREARRVEDELREFDAMLKERERRAKLTERDRWS